MPKAVYVVETSNAIKDQEARPLSVWRILLNHGSVFPENIAIFASTKDLPKEAVRDIDQLSDTGTHIIFNKKLQGGI